jgi:(1->4)-alpha-D-glucan 1-alpha-D-glucosylmutase
MPSQTQAIEQTQAIDELIREAMDRIRTHRVSLQSTYRLQFHKNFTFRDAAAIVPYLASLGVTHVYASPYLKARPGSMHGYDVIDHCRLNPELGSTEDFDAFLAALEERQMSHLCDMVPNHVGIGTNDNVWWNDVLENGPASIYANYFDINWAGSPLTDLQGRVLVPILGERFSDALEKQQLQVKFAGGAFAIHYFQRIFPVSPRSFPLILAPGLDSSGLPETAAKNLRTLLEECGKLPDRCQGATIAAQRHQEKESIKKRLAEAAADPAVAAYIEKSLKKINGIAGRPASFDSLEKLLRQQCYRLAYWRTAPDEINYRRFFDVNDLAALAMERPEVFEATHTYILGLLAQNKIAGLRVDHPDGLYDPRRYFQRLQNHYVLAVAGEVARTSPRFSSLKWDALRADVLARLEAESPLEGDNGRKRQPLYVLGEKILARGEALPRNWPIDGTTGYQFLNMTNGLFVDRAAESEFTRRYYEFIGDATPFEEIVYAKKKLILEISMASELNMLAIELKRIAQHSRQGVDYSLHGLLVALREVIACFPVYRSYIVDGAVSEADRNSITQAIDAAIRRNPKLEPSVFHFIRDVLLIAPAGSDDADRAARSHFAGKFQQLSSPVTAKGIEDTSFYIYDRLLSLNEVGGDPACFGIEPAELHAFFEDRQKNWPRTMSTLSTHDTKRSEDVRARLNVLSEMPGEWFARVARWFELNAPHRRKIGGIDAPDRNEEYALYQSILGAYPLESGSLAGFVERIQNFMLKAMREAKVRTNWTDPNKDREEAIKNFIAAILDESRSKQFLEDFRAFHRKISDVGIVNSLAQSLIKLAAPGIPDTYQGTEAWDFSLVDPDNRRPVDFALRRRLADEALTAHAAYQRDRQSPAVKLAVHRAVLRCRSQYPDLFVEGKYLPLKSSGSNAAHLFAFARTHNRHIAVVAVPRLSLKHAGDWTDTEILLPAMAEGRSFTNLFTANRLPAARGARYPAAEVFADFPIALLIAE